MGVEDDINQFFRNKNFYSGLDEQLSIKIFQKKDIKKILLSSYISLIYETYIFITMIVIFISFFYLSPQ